MNQIIKKKIGLASVIIMMFSANILNSQNISDFNQILSSESYSKSTNSEIQELKSFYQDYHPTVIIGNDEIKKSEEAKCKVLDLSVRELELLYINNSVYYDIEFIKISINKSDRIKSLDFSNLSSFKNLKYVLFQFDYQPDKTLLSNLVSNHQGSIPSLYFLVSIPE
ncbi:MAG: hypothetical protein PHE56_08830 [Bacteroidales bacterium]|nr:hypothetical protein [Bacteroidales bacterium]